MIFKKLITVLALICVNYHKSDALDFARFYTLDGVSQPLPPLPSRQAVNCLNQISEDLYECRNQSFKHWAISDYSSLGEACCAQWDILDCDMDYVAKSKCASLELDEVNEYFEDLIDFYSTKTCHLYPRGGTQCMAPMLSAISDQKPPEPSPLAIDCLLNIKPIVRLGCLETARLKWNITHHSKPPVRNLCCAAWDDIDCLDEIAQVRCPASEVAPTEKYFKQLETWAESVGGCSAAAYHSKACSTVKRPKFDHASRILMPKLLEPQNAIPFPQSSNRDKTEPREMDLDYTNFLMNYVMTVFPHLLNLIVLLAIILVTVVLIQCFIIARQIKHERYFQNIAPNAQGYHKINI